LADPAFDRDRRAVVERASAQGVGFILAVGSDLETSRKAIDVAGSFQGVYAAIGVHPHEVKGVDSKTLPALASMAGHSRVVAVGEIGLDYYRNNSPQKAQRHWFREQVRLAIKAGKPVVVHCRDAGEDVHAILAEEKVWRVGGVVHCFTGAAELAQKLLALDLHLGAAGPIVFEGGEALREAFAGVPIERILVETDSPYLAPPPMRGKRNEPALAYQVAEALAGIHGLSVGEVARITSSNARRLFGIGPAPKAGALAYPHQGRLYLNITNRCQNACYFCGLLSDRVFKGHDLTLPADPGQEPGAQAVLAAAGDPSGYEEVVFSGFGEPTLRLDVLVEVARGLRERGARRIRLVTNGLGGRSAGRDILNELRGLFDAVSVSLQAATPEAYAKVCKTQGIADPYPSVKDFIRGARLCFPEVEATAVAMPGIDLAACERVAREELGVPFRARPYVLTD
jgi:TatD DNase family protein